MTVVAGREQFGLWTLTFLVIANMIGAGVFTTSGFAIQGLGSPGRVVLAWAIGGVIALAGAASYGRLARIMPESGGEYLYLSRAAHPLLGFVAGWVSLVAGFTGAIALAATAFEGYVLPEQHRPCWLPANTIAIMVVVAGGISHGLRPRGGAALQNVVVVLKLGLFLGFLSLAAAQLPADVWQGEALPEAPTGIWAISAAFATSLVWISLSYSGFNAAVYVAGEARDPRSTVPRAMLVGTCIVLVIYVLLNAVFVYSPPPERISGMPDVAAIAAQWLGGSRAATFVRVMIAFSLLTSVSSMMMAAPRVYAKMADDGLLPSFLRLRKGAPRQAVAAQVLLAVVFILISSLRGLLSYLGLTLSLCAVCSVGCLFLPSVRRRSFHRMSYGPPLVYITCTMAAVAIMAIDDPSQLLGTAVTFAVGILVYLAVPRSTWLRPSDR